MKKNIPILCFLTFVCLIMFVSCTSKQNDSPKTSNAKDSVNEKYETFYDNLYVDIIKTDSSKVRITFEWDDIDGPCPVGRLVIEEDNFSKRPVQIALYIFEQRKDSLFLHTEWEDNVDTCYIRNISNDSIVIVHKNKDLFYTNRDTTVLYRGSSK